MDDHLLSNCCSPSYLADLSSDDDNISSLLLEANKYPTYEQFTPPSSASLNSGQVTSFDAVLFHEPSCGTTYTRDDRSCGSCSPTSLCSLDERRVSGRKQSRPKKSPSRNDPDFQGVTASVKFTIDKNLSPRLDFDLCYSLDDWLGKPMPCKYLSQATTECSSRLCYRKIGYSHGKQCASCKTRKTPLWRDAEDGTPLCNACGIRYKKYRVRCNHCWHIPKKENKNYSRCPNCGDFLKESLNRNKSQR